MQRSQCFASATRFFRRLRFGKSPVEEADDYGVELLVDLLDFGDVGLDHFSGRNVAVPNHCCQVGSTRAG